MVPPPPTHTPVDSRNGDQEFYSKLTNLNGQIDLALCSSERSCLTIFSGSQSKKIQKILSVPLWLVHACTHMGTNTHMKTFIKAWVPHTYTCKKRKITSLYYLWSNLPASWTHIETTKMCSRIPCYISSAMFSLSCVMQIISERSLASHLLLCPQLIFDQVFITSILETEKKKTNLQAALIHLSLMIKNDCTWG